MKQLLFSVITLLSLAPFATVRAQDQAILPAMDPRVLKLFIEPKDQIAVRQVELLQKNFNQGIRIQELENTIEERSYRRGFNTGLTIGIPIGAVTVAAVLLILNRKPNSCR